MKYLVIIAVICTSYMNAASTSVDPVNEKEKKKKEKTENLATSKNFHSIKKWKMTIEYNNGTIISKTFSVSNTSTSSPMELAFLEAEKYTKSVRKVKNYRVAPVSNNSYVLLAGGK